METLEENTELETEGEEIEVEEGEVEDWQKVDDPDSMPVTTHIKMKQKLKGRIGERDDEISKLKSEVEALKGNRIVKPATDTPIMPKRAEFDDDDLYNEAIDKYHEEVATVRHNRLEFQRTQTTRQQESTQKVAEGIDDHYSRAAKLVETTGIKPEAYQKTDEVVRSAIDSILPKNGDLVFDQVVSALGEGSEKVIYFLGRNKAALNEFKGLLAEDPSGLKVAMFLGRQTQRFNKSGGATSAAPEPAPRVAGGDVPTSASGKKLKKAFEKAEKADNAQGMYDAKKAAKLAGIDTKGW